LLNPLTQATAELTSKFSPALQDGFSPVICGKCFQPGHFLSVAYRQATSSCHCFPWFIFV